LKVGLRAVVPTARRQVMPQLSAHPLGKLSLRIMKQYYTILKILLFFVGTACQFSVSQSLVDFFPLKPGNQWNYSYKSIENRYEEFLLLQTTIDSGSVNFSIADSLFQDSVIVWHILENDSIQRTIQDYFHQTDTSYSVIGRFTFPLYEYLDSTHRIKSQSNYEIFTFPIRWISFGNVTSTTPIPRYARDSSLMVIKEKQFLIASYSDSLVFKKDIGLVYAKSVINKGPNSFYYYEWHASLSSMTTGVNDQGNYVPREFVLFQNYPNPFNPVTNISFQLMFQTHVTLDIYDLVGRKVAHLVDSYLQAGMHNVQWDGSKHASGIYFYRIILNGRVETKEMILLK
jgi:hypothetical protein